MTDNITEAKNALGPYGKSVFTAITRAAGAPNTALALSPMALFEAVQDAEAKLHTQMRERASGAVEAAMAAAQGFNLSLPDRIDEMARVRRLLQAIIMKGRLHGASVLDGAHYVATNEDSDGEVYAFDDGDIDTMVLNTPPDFLRKLHTAIGTHLGDLPISGPDMNTLNYPEGATTGEPTSPGSSSSAKEKKAGKAKAKAEEPMVFDEVTKAQGLPVEGAPKADEAAKGEEGQTNG